MERIIKYWIKLISGQSHINYDKNGDIYRQNKRALVRVEAPRRVGQKIQINLNKQAVWLSNNCKIKTLKLKNLLPPEHPKILKSQSLCRPSLAELHTIIDPSLPPDRMWYVWERKKTKRMREWGRREGAKRRGERKRLRKKEI